MHKSTSTQLTPTDDIPEDITEYNNVILHEIAHCLGIGTVWDGDNLNLLSATCTSTSTGPIYYTGAKGVAAYQTTNCNEVWGQPQPFIETNAGSGSSCSHWAEAQYNTELMTPVSGV